MLHFLQRGMFSQPLPSVVFAFLKYLHQQLGIPVVVAHHLVFQYRKRKIKHLLVLEKTLEMVHIYKQVNERDLTAQFCRFMWFVWSTETLQMHFQRWSRDERFAPNSRNRQVKNKKKPTKMVPGPYPAATHENLPQKCSSRLLLSFILFLAAYSSSLPQSHSRLCLTLGFGWGPFTCAWVTLRSCSSILSQLDVRISFLSFNSQQSE